MAALAPLAAGAAGANPLLDAGRRHPLVVTPPGAAPLATPPNAHLDYFGGRVISGVEIVMVLWGAGTYQPFVSGGTGQTMAAFYPAVFGGPYMGGFAEYDTHAAAVGGAPGSNQSIGRGSFRGTFTISPSAPGTVIDDVAIQQELGAQIAAGALPPPTLDAAGNANTLYAIHFPHGVKITQGGAGSCVAGGFCAYHGTVAPRAAGGANLYYAVLPDMSAGSGCDVGCGAGSAFANQTSVASHEVVEAITDAEVGLATAFGPPLGWYDSVNNAEIGDLCNGQQGPVAGADGATYTVQKEWSNAANACVVDTADFTVTAPGAAELAPGGSATLTISTARIGFAQTLALAASGVPAGFQVAFAPATIAAGGSATLTVSDTGAAAPQTIQLTVTAAGPFATHTALASVVVARVPLVSAATLSTPPRGTIAFGASGGTGAFVWSLATNASGGRIDAATGLYTAGATGSVADVVRVTDALGASGTASVTVTAGVSVSPASTVVAAGAGLPFNATGGSNAGFTWSLAANPSGARVDAVTGLYTAGATAGVTDVVRATDSLGNAATATVAVTAAAPLAIAPASPSVSPRATLHLSAQGGSGTGLTWTLLQNASGGSVGADGTYRAGATGGVVDVVQVTDATGAAAVRDVAVTAGVSVSPAALTVAPGGSAKFSAAGGSGTGFTWSLAANLSGGSVDPATGAYTAGDLGGGVDLVQAADSLGNTATAVVTVGAAPPVAQTPAPPTTRAVAAPHGGCSGGAGGPASLAALALALLAGRRRTRR